VKSNKHMSLANQILHNKKTLKIFIRTAVMSIREKKTCRMNRKAQTCMTQHLNLIFSSVVSIWTIFLLPLLICTNHRKTNRGCDAQPARVFKFVGAFTQAECSSITPVVNLQKNT